MLAVALAWLTERSDLPAARSWAWLAVAPLAVPAFVHSYAWVSLVPGAARPVRRRAGRRCSPISRSSICRSRRSLRRLDPALEDTAASLGLDPWRVFFRVVLPQLRLAICGGSLLVGLHLLAEYGLFVMIRFDTFTTAIVDQFQSAYQRPGRQHAGRRAGACAASRCCGSRLALRGRERYARSGAGAARQAPRGGASAGPPLPCLLARRRSPSPWRSACRSSPWRAGCMAGGAEVWRLHAIGAALGQTLALAVGRRLS